MMYKIALVLFLIALGLSPVVAQTETPNENWEMAACVSCERVTDLAWSPDSRWLGAAMTSGLYLYQTREVHGRDYRVGFNILAGETQLSNKPTSKVAWSPDSKLIASEWNLNLNIWNAATHELIATLPAPAGAAFSWHPQQNILAYSTGFVVAFWERNQPEPRLANDISFQNMLYFKYAFPFLQERGWIWEIAWNSTGDRLAILTNYHGLWLWNAETEQVEKRLELPSSWIRTISWHPDGRHLLTLPLTPDSMWFIDTQTDEITELQLQQATTAAWNHDGTRIVTNISQVSDRAIIWNTETWEIVHETRDYHFDYVYAVAWSANGQWIATGSRDGQIIIWEPRRCGCG